MRSPRQPSAWRMIDTPSLVNTITSYKRRGHRLKEGIIKYRSQIGLPSLTPTRPLNILRCHRGSHTSVSILQWLWGRKGKSFCPTTDRVINLNIVMLKTKWFFVPNPSSKSLTLSAVVWLRNSKTVSSLGFGHVTSVPVADRGLCNCSHQTRSDCQSRQQATNPVWEC